MRTRFLLFAALPLAGVALAFAACSSSEPDVPVVERDAATLTQDAPSVLDVYVEDVIIPPVDAGPVPHCSPVDIEAGTGTKFCDLPGTDAPGLQVPAGFCIREFTTTPVTETRVLRFAPNGDLFVAAPSMNTPGGASDGAGGILVLPDDDGDGRADSILTYAGPSPRMASVSCATLEGDVTNLACVHGLAFANGYLYFTRSDEVRRVPYTAGDRVISGTPSELVAKLGGAALPDARWTHTLELTKSGALYVSRGRYDSSGCSAEQMIRGSVFALHIEGAATLPLTPELVSSGFRNPMYLRCSPASCGECYASELSGDDWDGVGGREKIALLEKDSNWGYPCCVGPGMNAPGGAGVSCANVGRETTPIPLHDTPFGFDFDRGAFPAPYTHGLFSALHGVRTSFGGSGVVWIKADPVSLRPTGAASAFVTGFGNPVGRATDAVFAPDGRLFIGDDTSGKIYWVAPRTLAKP